MTISASRRGAERAAALALALMAGSGAQAGETSIDVGYGIRVPVDPAAKLSIAYFSIGTGNSYLTANIRAAKETAAKGGADIQIFDAKFDPTTQYNQVQNALQSKRYNAFILAAADGSVLCKIATEDAPRAGILVSAIGIQLCGRATKQGEAQWAPGTLNFVGGALSYDTYSAWYDHVVTLNPGPQKVGFLTGPDLVSYTIIMHKILDEMKAKHPEFQVVERLQTDYSVPDSLKKAQNLIQAHPDLTIIMTVYSNLTRGVVGALEQAGKTGTIKVYDAGGTAWAKKAVLRAARSS